MTADSELVRDGYPMVMLAEDMCRLLRIHPNTLYARIRAGQVPAFEQVGRGAHRRYEWLRPNVEKWLLQRRQILRKVVG